MIPSARQDDLHVCPLPGHGSTPILSASSNVLINSMGSVRVGDVCACGAVIVVGFPTVRANGRPMAHLGSLSSHGGAIVTASQDVGGGFGGAAGPVIDFSRLGIIRPDGTFDEQRLTSLLADPDLVSKAKAADALIDPLALKPDKAKAMCTHPDEMIHLARYIAEEVNRNIHHPTVLKMKELLAYDVAEETKRWMELPWYAQIGAANNPQTVGSSKLAAALAMWTERVGQDRPWDHKTAIRAMYNGRAWHKQGGFMYFHDIWSNIHYGYVGMACGLSEEVLLDGAGLEQIVSDSVRKIENWPQRPGPHRSADIDGLRAWDDAPDRISIGIGIELYRLHPKGDLAPSMIKNKVLAVGVSDWGAGIEPHDCNKVAHIL